ncbi:Zinc finger protein 91, partial [Stegodyphus mimosarum]
MEVTSKVQGPEITSGLNEEAVTSSDIQKKKSKGHRCFFCGQRFIQKNVLRKHISIHKDRDFFCEVCGKAFSTSWGLRKHMKTHTGERPYQCEYCEKAFIQKCTLQFHIKAIHSNKSHPRCKSCGKRLKSFSYVQCWLCRYEGKEIDEHINQQSAQGEECTPNLESKSNDSSDLKQTELNSSLSEKINSNKEPNVKEGENASIISHILRPENNEFSPSMCDKLYLSGIDVNQQIDSGQDLIYICEHCGLNFRNSIEMRKHLISHTNLRPFMCEKCGKDFKRDYNLKQHMVTHKEERPFICKICKRTFKSIPCLKQHLVSHSDDRPFVCKDCGSGFKSTQGLKTHRMIHNKEKPLACKTCGKTFNFLGNLQRHFRIHTGERPYQCKLCPKKFSQSNGLKAHEFTHTKPVKAFE